MAMVSEYVCCRGSIVSKWHGKHEALIVPLRHPRPGNSPEQKFAYAETVYRQNCSPGNPSLLAASAPASHPPTLSTGSKPLFNRDSGDFEVIIPVH
ncbi:hypothetical protein LSTR_LSTR017218 [Laodelphax striatellus]|uniref:Uncharacterized protein n=1 Tax=Laodelphax striatellus TaxID=195883 RepID=A0A482WM82_LAOST|nr:hypothetical protein LSTR_LSTR017218 [Laodelphax striatellus]